MDGNPVDPEEIIVVELAIGALPTGQNAGRRIEKSLHIEVLAERIGGGTMLGDIVGFFQTLASSAMPHRAGRPARSRRHLRGRSRWCPTSCREDYSGFPCPRAGIAADFIFDQAVAVTVGSQIFRSTP